MLVDGLGDGLMMEGPFDLSFLRTTSFATLQVRLYTHTYINMPIFLAFIDPPVCGLVEVGA